MIVFRPLARLSKGVYVIKARDLFLLKNKCRSHRNLIHVYIKSCETFCCITLTTPFCKFHTRAVTPLDICAMFYHFDVAQIKSICAENINYYALMATAEVNVTVSGMIE